MGLHSNTFSGSLEEDFEGTIYKLDDESEWKPEERNKLASVIARNSDQFYRCAYWKQDGEGNYLFFVPKTGLDEEKINFYFNNVKHSVVQQNTAILNTKDSSSRSTIEELTYESIRHYLSHIRGLWKRRGNTYCLNEYTRKNKFRIYEGFQVRVDVRESGAIDLTIDPKTSITHDKSVKEFSEDEGLSKFLEGNDSTWALVDYPENKKKVILDDVKTSVGLNDARFDNSDQNVYDYQIEARPGLENVISSEEPVLMAKRYSAEEPSPWPSSIVYPFAQSEDYPYYISKMRIKGSEDRSSTTLKYRERFFDYIEIGDWVVSFEGSFKDADHTKLELPDLEFGSGTMSFRQTGKSSWKYVKKDGMKQYGPKKDQDLRKIFFVHPERENQEDVKQFYEDLRSVSADYGIELPEKSYVKFEGIDLNNYDDLIRRFEKYERSKDRKYDYMLAVLPRKSEAAYDSIKNLPIKSQAINSVYYDRGDKYYDDKLFAIATAIVGETGYPWLLGEELYGDCIVGIDVSDKNVWSYSFTFGEKGKYLGASKGKVQKSESIESKKFKAGIKKAIKVDYSRQESDEIERLIIHRDGELTKDEKKGLREALGELKSETEVITDETEYIALDVRKKTAFRTYDEFKSDRFGQPDVGSIIKLSDSQALVSTNGYPYITQGTAQPLLLSVEDANCEYDLEKLGRDLIFLSELNWSSPNTPWKIPVTIKFAEDISELLQEGYNIKNIHL